MSETFIEVLKLAFVAIESFGVLVAVYVMLMPCRRMREDISDLDGRCSVLEKQIEAIKSFGDECQSGTK